MFKQAIGSVLIAGAMAGGLALAAPAQATTMLEAQQAMCGLLDKYPTSMVMPLLALELKKQDIVAEGVIVLYTATRDVCPEHFAAVDAWMHS